MSINEKLAKIKEEENKNFSSDAVRIISEFIQQLQNSGIEDRVVKNGQKAPDFRLVNALGFFVSLQELLKRGPLIISFYRGSWCPYCSMEIITLNKYLPEFQALGASLVAISPETPDSSVNAFEKLNLSYEILSDSHNMTAKKFGLVYRLSENMKNLYINYFGLDLSKFNADDSWELPVPATFVVDKNGIIADLFVDVDYSRRMDPEWIISALKRLKSHDRSSNF